MKRDPSMLRILTTVRDQGLPDSVVAAGAVRTLVWNHLHGFARRSSPEDIDVLFLDPSEGRTDAEINGALTREMPSVTWDAVNQASVHTWVRDTFGIVMSPLASTVDGLATFSETATPVGVRLEEDDSITVLAPLGLDDLFAMVLRPNPRCPDPGLFQRRLETKRFRERWPRVELLPGYRDAPPGP